MSNVIKVHDRSRADCGTQFNFEDLTDRAQAYLDEVRRQAAEMVAAARKEADRIRAQAQQQGRAEGLREVDQKTEQRVADQMQTLRPALEQVINKLDEARHTWLSHWERSAVRLAAAIAARLIRRPLETTPEITVDLVREALELAAGSAHLRVYLDPGQHAAMASRVEALLAQAAPLAKSEVLADPHLSPGGCRLETQFGVIDQSFDAQLARIEEELT